MGISHTSGTALIAPRFQNHGRSLPSPPQVQQLAARKSINQQADLGSVTQSTLASPDSRRPTTTTTTQPPPSTLPESPDLLWAGGNGFSGSPASASSDAGLPSNAATSPSSGVTPGTVEPLANHRKSTADRNRSRGGVRGSTHSRRSHAGEKQ